MRHYDGRMKKCRGCRKAFKTSTAPKFVVAHKEMYVYGRVKGSKRLLMTERDFLPARRYASAGNSDRNVSVCPSVCHAPVLCQNEES